MGLDGVKKPFGFLLEIQNDTIPEINIAIFQFYPIMSEECDI